MTISTLYENTPTSSNTLPGWEAGLKFYSNVNGNITALRYYKVAGGTGTVTGRIWNSSGTLLASVVFSGETASGWQEQALTTPLAITSGTNYVVSRNITDKLGSTTNLLSASVPTANTTNQLFLPIRAGVFKNGGAGNFPDGGGTGNDYYAVSFKFDDLASSSSIALNPTSIVAGSSGNAIAVTGTGTNYTPGTPGSPTFTLSGGTGASITSQVISSTAAATLTIAAGSAAGTLVISDGTNTANLTVLNALTAGALTLTSRNTSLVAAFSRTAATGGTGTVTAQLQVSTDGTSYSNVSGATGTTPTYTASTPGQYYFRVAYTDSASTPVTVYSNIITTVLSTEQIFLGFIGNSIAAGTVSGSPPPPTTTAATLETLYGYRMCSFSNRGVSGSYTSLWVPGQTNYTNALATFNSASTGIAKKYVLIMLGTNDASVTNGSISKATYKANLASICADLISNGYIVVLNYPIWSSNSNISLSLLLQYQQAINELINGSTILQGDTFSYQYFLQNQAYIADNIHPNQTGANNLGDLWARAFWRAVYSTKPALSVVRRTIRL